MSKLYMNAMSLSREIAPLVNCFLLRVALDKNYFIPGTKTYSQWINNRYLGGEIIKKKELQWFVLYQ